MAQLIDLQRRLPWRKTKYGCIVGEHVATEASLRLVVRWFIELSKSPQISLVPPSYDRYSEDSVQLVHSLVGSCRCWLLSLRAVDITLKMAQVISRLIPELKYLLGC